MQRLLTVMSVTIGLSGFVFITQQDYFRYRWHIDGMLIGAAFLLSGAVIFTFSYLQSGGSKGVLSERDYVTMVTEVFYKLQGLEEQAALAQSRSQVIEPVIELTAEERYAAIQNVIDKTGEEVLQNMFDEKSQALQKELKKGAQAEIKATAKSTVERIRREITDLRLRSNVNLSIGMGITGLGLYLLWTTVGLIDSSTLLKTLASEGSDTNAKFVKNLVLPVVPRTMLVVFIEVFAYFFLRLYRVGLADMKYFQNELTNIESKLISVEYAVATDHSESLKASLESLAKTERNFILEKGQTTVELERAKSESELVRNVLKAIPELFKKSKPE
jgi:hypothetical protein